MILNGTNLLILLRELGELGSLQVELDVSQVPSLNEMDPERCYLAWDMVLDTAAGREAIRDIFIFIEDECEIRIEPAPQQAPPAADPSSVAPEAGKAYRPDSGNGTETASRGAASSIRVSAEKLDQLVNLVGELVTVQARLSEVSARRDDADIQAISEEIDRLTAELRENSMSIRMLPLRNTFERFRRLVHDLGSDLQKQVELAIEGADTELDKTVIDQLNDPLVHLIRNSMDHGIETPEARRAAGKPATATIRLSAQHSGAQVLIRVSDDGRGLDAAAVRERAIEQGLIDASAQLSESELYSSDPGARLLDGPAGHRCLRPGRRHGRGPAQRRGSARLHRDRQPAGSRPHRHPAPSPDAGHHRRAAGARRPGASSCCRWPTVWNASS